MMEIRSIIKSIFNELEIGRIIMKDIYDSKTLMHPGISLKLNNNFYLLNQATSNKISKVNISENADPCSEFLKNKNIFLLKILVFMKTKIQI